MAELAFESFPQFFEGGQLPNVHKSAVSWELNTHSEDKLFAAILKALVLLGNKPCSPQEIATCILKYELTVLGGSNPSGTVSARISQYFEYVSALQSTVPLLLSKLEDQTNPEKTKYYLSYCNRLQSSNDVHSSLNKKRPSSYVEQSVKKLKSDESEVLTFDDSWVTDNGILTGMELFGQSRDAYEFDTIIPIEYESEESPNDSDGSIDDRIDSDSKSDAESFDSESEVEQSDMQNDFCEDMMNGNLDFDLLTDSVDNGVSSLLSDQEFHSDSSHSSFESGISSASPLLTPEPSPRRGSEVLDAISTVQPSPFFDSVIDLWENQGFQNEPNTKYGYNDMLRLENLQIPELDELLGINEGSLEHENASVDSVMDKLITNPEPIKEAHLLGDRSLDQLKTASVEHSSDLAYTLPTKASVVAQQTDDEVTSFLCLDEDLGKDTSAVVKPTAPQDQVRHPLQIPGPIMTAKPKSKNTKNKTRNISGPESNPNMLISSITPISPQIFITMVESLPFYVTTVGPADGFNNTYQLLRRYDSGYVNATTLLSVGGVESEKEQAVVLSLEIGRIRIRRRESPLFGTWIPLPRARQLAATCSLQQKLGPFLDYDLPNYFPSQLPPHIAAFNPAQVSSRLRQFIRSRAASLKPRDNTVANIGIAPRCLHPTSKSFFSGVGHQLNQILGLQSKQMKSYSALENSNNPRRPSKSKPNSNEFDEIQTETDYLIEEGSEVDGEEFEEDFSSFLDFENEDSVPSAIEDNVDININGRDVEPTFCKHP